MHSRKTLFYSLVSLFICNYFRIHGQDEKNIRTHGYLWIKFIVDS